LRKNFAGRRCEQKTLRPRFLAQPDGQHGHGRVLLAQHSFSSACRAEALAKAGYLRVSAFICG
ncbi:MAG TPA: hypothetical protein VNW30_06490, partial [Opitutaceae bacterium]|nr:hypothetical protein [Opitutaceae bacterium]